MSRTVLILEDSLTQAQIVGKLFERAGFAPTLVHNISTAFVALRKQRFDLLVMDVFVTEHNTLDHMADIRRFAPETPIAVMTAGKRTDALASSQALNLARRQRADFLLPKPFTYEDIQQICSDLTRKVPSTPEQTSSDEAYYL